MGDCDSEREEVRGRRRMVTERQTSRGGDRMGERVSERIRLECVMDSDRGRGRYIEGEHDKEERYGL